MILYLRPRSVIWQHPDRLRNPSARLAPDLSVLLWRSGQELPSNEHLVQKSTAPPVAGVSHCSLTVQRAISEVQQVEWPQRASPTELYCQWEELKPVLKLRLWLLLQQQDPPPPCSSKTLPGSLSWDTTPPRLLQSAASSMSAGSAGSRTHTWMGPQLKPRPPGLRLKISSWQLHPIGGRECSSWSLIGKGGALSHLLLLEFAWAVRSPNPKDRIFNVRSVILSQPDRSRCFKERHAPNSAQLEE